MKNLLRIIILILSSTSFTYASHPTGAEIWYEHDTLNNYTIHCRVYNACQSLTAGPTMNLYYKSTSLAVTPQTVTMNLDTAYYYNSCATTNCVSPTATIYGFQVGEYTASVTLSGQATDWYFYTWITRAAGYNLVSNGVLYVDASLDNLNVPFNNSVMAHSAINMNQYFNSQSTLNLPIVDVDGDSIDVHFIQPLTGTNTGVPTNLGIQAPYTINNPFNSTPAPLLNSANGNMTLYSNGVNIGGYSVALRFDEYRNGNLIGSTVRDYAMIYTSNSANSVPALSGVNNTSSYITTIDVCPSASLSFTINSSDPDVGDATFIDPLYIPAGATFTTNAAQNQVGTFTWTPTIADVRSEPYVISFNVRDDSCSLQSYGYQIYVNNCNPDSVWAGDANADFTCDNYDVLNIGIANGSAGAVRPLATTNWQAEWCANWGNSFISNINHKHADCNGDGTVDNLDLAAVTANYGQVHFKTNKIGQYKTAGLPDLYCDVNSVTAERGTTVNIPVMLGTTGSVMNDFYGMAGTVELLNAQTSAPISITNSNSWIGNTTNSFSFEKSLAANKSAFTFVRNDQQNVAMGQGQIGTIEFPIDASSVLGSQVVIQFSDLQLIDKDGNEIADYNVLSDTLTIVAPTAVNDLNNVARVSIYPNPAKDVLNVEMGNSNLESASVIIYDALGRKLISKKLKANPMMHSYSLDVSKLPQAVYLLEIKTGEMKQTHRFSKF